MQVQLGVVDLAAAQFESAAEDAEIGDVGVEPPDVKQRIAVVVGDVELLDVDLREEPDIDPSDPYGRSQLARDGLRDTVHRIVLYGGDVEQQREAHGQDYQQQNRRG